MKFAKCLLGVLAIAFLLGFAYSGEAKAEIVYAQGTIEHEGSPVPNKALIMVFTYRDSNNTLRQVMLNNTVSTDEEGNFLATFDTGTYDINWGQVTQVTLGTIEDYSYAYYQWTPKHIFTASDHVFYFNDVIITEVM